MTNEKHHDNTGSASRRTVLKAGAAAGLLTMGAPFIRPAHAAGPVKLGILLPKSGTYAAQGGQGHNGAMLAIDDFGGQVNGRKIESIWLDENGPQTSQQNMIQLVEKEHVAAVQGGVSSGDILACMPVAERTKTLLMASGPNASEITGNKCNRYTFRVDLPNYATVRAVYPYLADKGKNWYFIYAAYAWGIDGFNQMKEVLVENGGKVVGADQTPLGTTDFSSYILKVMAAEPDVVFLGIGGGDLTNFLKQFRQMGLTDKIPVSSLISNDTDLWAAGKEAAAGIYPKIWNYTGKQNTEKSKHFAETYQDRFKTAPESEAWQDYFSMIALLTAIKETSSTDSMDLIEFLEKHKFEGYKERPIYFRSWNHQLIQPILIAKVKPEITDEYDYFDIEGVAPKADEPMESIYASKEVAQCSM
jgi:branched-chain amino acid transport system substrate-binding protein